MEIEIKKLLCPGEALLTTSRHESVCVCARAHVHICLSACVSVSLYMCSSLYVSMYAFGTQRPTLAVVPQVLFTLVSDTGSPLAWNLRSRLSCQ